MLQALTLITGESQESIAKQFAAESLDYTEDPHIRKMLPTLGFSFLTKCQGDEAQYEMMDAGGGKFVLIMTASGTEGHMLAAKKIDKKKGGKITDYQRNDPDAKLYKSDTVEIWQYG